MNRSASALLLLAVAALAGAQASPEDKKVEAEKKKLAKLEKSYKETKAAYLKLKTDEPKKKAYVAATVKLATATMHSPILGAKVKYPKALRLYREALTIDPHNKEAAGNKQLIVDIYKQMGREIPK
jgi:tetratricopeptide (TPR) repeat protein